MAPCRRCRPARNPWRRSLGSETRRELRATRCAAKAGPRVPGTIPFQDQALGEKTGPSIDAAFARDCLIAAAREAGVIALGYFRVGERTSARVDYKAGGSPVTEADLAVDAFLRARLGGGFGGGGRALEGTEGGFARLLP